MSASGACPECYAFERELKSLELELNDVILAQPTEYCLSLIRRDMQDSRDLYQRHLRKVHEILEPERL